MGKISPFLQIGSVPTPWPSWLIAAHPTRAPADALKPFLATLTTYVRAFDSPDKRASEDVAFIKEKFGYAEEDIKVGMSPSNDARCRLLTVPFCVCMCVRLVDIWSTVNTVATLGRPG